jgi:gluconate 2-dehydrogenase gamma chain
MGGQGIERRDILRYIGVASVAGAFPGFSKWAFACAQEHVHAIAAPSGTPAAQTSPGPYKPLFFSPQHYQMIEHLVEMIIPTDETAGAKEAGVAEFIDFMVANRVPVSGSREVRSTEDAMELGNEAQTRFLLGLDWTNARSKSEFGHEFMDCTSEQQRSLLEELAYKAKFQPTTESGRAFFQFLRDYTVVGYYTTKIGLESLGYPGLRAVWPSMPGCSHADDPEHVHLTKPKGEVGRTHGAVSR